MNSKLDLGKLQGSFSTYSLNPEHKQRLENFIKRKRPDSVDKDKSRSKSPIISKIFGEKERFGQSSPIKQLKEKELARKESEILRKEVELQEKEKKLIEISERILGQCKDIGDGKRIEPSPIDKREKLLAGKIETLISAEAEIDQLRQKISNKVSGVQSKIRYLQKSLKESKDKHDLNQKKQIKSFCTEIVHSLIPLALISSLTNSTKDLDARLSSTKLASQKLKSTELKLSNCKSILEKQALSLLSTKSDLAEKSAEIQLKSSEITELSQSIGKSEKLILLQTDSLKKKEESLSQKQIQIAQLEKQIQDQELSLLLLSKQKVDSAQNSTKSTENLFFARENAIKHKENELKERKKNLDEKKNVIDEIKSKIRWRMNNIVSLERKSEKMKMEVEGKVMEFEEFVKSEEKALELWREKVRKKERDVDELRNKCRALEGKAMREVREFDTDSIEVFERIEKEVEKNIKADKKK